MPFNDVTEGLIIKRHQYRDRVLGLREQPCHLRSLLTALAPSQSGRADHRGTAVTRSWTASTTSMLHLSLNPLYKGLQCNQSGQERLRHVVGPQFGKVLYRPIVRVLPGRSPQLSL